MGLLSSEEWFRVKELWEARIQTINEIVVQGGELIAHLNELKAFTRWVLFIPEDLRNFYPLIKISALAADDGDVNELIEFLASFNDEHAPFTVSLLEALLEQSHRGSWFLRDRHSAEYVQKMLETAMDSGDEQTKASAARVINLFGKRGDERYRDLLDLMSVNAV